MNLQEGEGSLCRITNAPSPQLLFDMDKEIFPMVVQAVVDEGEGKTLYQASYIGA